MDDYERTIPARADAVLSRRLPLCPSARKMLEQLKPELEQRSVKVEELNTWTPRGVEEARSWGASPSPTSA